MNGNDKPVAPVAAAPVDGPYQRINGLQGIGDAADYLTRNPGDAYAMRHLRERLEQFADMHGARTPAATVIDPAMEAFEEFADDYLTDGNGYAPASTYDACSQAFHAAWPDRKAYEAAKAEFNRLHRKIDASPKGDEAQQAGAQAMVIAHTDGYRWNGQHWQKDSPKGVMCGGCGNADEAKRCLGCTHDFHGGCGACGDGCVTNPGRCVVAEQSPPVASPKGGSDALASAASRIVNGARKKAGGGWWMVSPSEMDELRDALQATSAEVGS